MTDCASAVFQIMQNQSFVSKYTYTAQSNNNLVNLLFRKLACAVTLLEQRIPRHVVLEVM